jgi:hypothetical protein
MRRMRIIGLCLVSAVALSALAATSASAALPEFRPPFPKAFSSTSGKTVLETVKKFKMTCTSDRNTGEVTGPKTGTVVITFVGCTIPGAPCSNVPETPGLVKTNTLVADLGYINKATKEVGLDLFNGNLIAQFTCGGVPVAVKGSVIGKLTPVNKIVNPPGGFTLKFAQAKGKQKITHLEGEPIDIPETSLGGGPFEESGLGSIDVLRFGEPAEVLA